MVKTSFESALVIRNKKATYKEMVPNREIIALVLICFLVSIFYFLKMNEVCSVIVIAGAILFFTKPFCELSMLISTSFIMTRIGANYVSILLFGITFLSFIINRSISFSKNKGILFLFAIFYLLFVFSYLFSDNANPHSLLSFYMASSLFLLFCCSPYKKRYATLIFVSLFLSGLSIIFIFILQSLSGNVSWNYYYLSFEGSKRTLADAITIVIVIFTHWVLSKKGLSLRISLLIYGIMAALFIMLLFTVSRGNIIAYVIFVALYLFFTAKKNINKLIAVFVVTFFAIFCLLLFDNSSFKNLFENVSGFNGRTTIWRAFLSMLTSNGTISFIFGLGPGSANSMFVEELGNTFYTHSTFFDTFITFGLFGGLFLIMIVTFTFASAIKHKNYLPVCFLSFSVFMYLTSGMSDNTIFYILLGFSYYLIGDKSENRRRNVISYS